MKIIISNIIQIEEPTKEIIDYCKHKLTFKNPDYSKKVQMGFWTGGTPKSISLYDYDGKNIYLPIGCFNDIWSMYPNKLLYSDYSVKVEREIKSNIKLRDYQEPCLNALKKYVNGLFILPCGLGKTECALQTAYYLQQHTLFITHTKDLMNQAKERCEDKMTCSTSIISDGEIDLSGDIVFATVQTLFKNLDKINQDEFGLVVVDECFPKGTKISTPEGYKNIEDINIGDYIYTYNHKLNKVEIEKVDYLFNKDVDDLIKIKHSYGSFVCTPNHPIYTNRGYIRADELLEGDVLYEVQLLSKRNCKRKFYKGTILEEGYISKTTRVESIEIQKPRNNGKSSKSNKRITVYNIGVSKNHNYFANDILVHNCHHLSANAESVSMFRTSLDHFASRYKLGLTATLHRADGLEQCIPKLLGDVVYEIKEDENDYVGIYENKEVIRFPKDKFQVPVQVFVVNTNYSLYNDKKDRYRDVFDKNGMTISFSKLLTDLANDNERNMLIAKLVKETSGSTIVLSDRVEQLKLLEKIIPNSIEIDGSTNKKVREQALDDVKDGKYRVLLASYKLAKEGLDCKILQNVVFATPVKDESIVIQSIGRAQRTYPGKTIANVYDIVDDVSMLSRFYTKRKNIYKRKGWCNK